MGMKNQRNLKIKAKTVGEVVDAKEELAHNGAVKTDIAVVKDGEKILDATKPFLLARTSIVVLLLMRLQHHQLKKKQEKISKTKVKTVGEDVDAKVELAHNGAVKMDSVVAKDGPIRDARTLYLLVKDSIAVLQLKN